MNTEEIKVEVPTEDSPLSSAEERIKSQQLLIDEQQKQIEQLVKQHELTKKINEQLNDTLNNKIKQEEEKTKDPFAWMKDAIGKDFEYQAKFNVNDNQDSYKGARQLATWHMRYLKDLGLSDEEIYSRLSRIYKGIETGIQAHESI